MIKPIKCAVTGASGYVGSRIAKYLRENKCIVYELRRDLPKHRDKFTIPFSLEKEISPDVLRGIDVIVHCAYDFSPVNWQDINEINVDGSLKLFRAAKEAGVKKIIFISTMAAFDGCKSLYGKAKLKIEEEAGKLGAVIVRPGLIYDDNPRGMFGALNKLISLSNIIPIVNNDNKLLYLCHSNDLSKLIFKLCTEKTGISKPIIAASENGFTLRNILKKLAAARKKKLVFIPVPYWLVLFGLKTFEKIGINIRFKTDNLISLVNQNEHPDFSATKEINVFFRTFNP